MHSQEKLVFPINTTKKHFKLEDKKKLYITYWHSTWNISKHKKCKRKCSTALHKHQNKTKTKTSFSKEKNTIKTEIE